MSKTSDLISIPLVLVVSVVLGVVSTFVLPSTPANSVAPEPVQPQNQFIFKDAAPILTSLEAASHKWIRLELSYLIQAPRRTEEHAILVERMIEDTLIYIQTLTPTLLEGAIGLANLKQNLTDRAATRSNGLVKEVFIRAMVLQ